jgi:hypothetical protein
VAATWPGRRVEFALDRNFIWAENNFAVKHMKTLILFIASIFVLQLQSALAVLPDEETRFVAAVKQAFVKHDAERLIALTCWDRVTDKFKDSGKKLFAKEVVRTVTDITLTNPNPQYPVGEWKEADGVTYGLNLPLTKQLKVVLSVKDKNKTPEPIDVIGPDDYGMIIFNVGEKNGKLYLLEPAPVMPKN